MGDSDDELFVLKTDVMGTFLGHMIPGVFFCVFSTWWLWNIVSRHYKARLLLRNHEYRSTATFSSSCCPNIPIEGIIKLALISLGILGEALTAVNHTTHGINWGNLHHITMFSFFGLTGLIDILVFYKLPLPVDSDYVTAMMAFIVEFILFHNHQYGGSPMEMMVHNYLSYSIGGCILALALEMKYRRNLLICLTRCFFTMLQGTWFIQVGQILYPVLGGEWSADDSSALMFVTMIYTWHFGAVFFYFLITTGIVYLVVKRKLKIKNASLEYHRMDNVRFKPNHEKSRLIASDEEEI